MTVKHKSLYLFLTLACFVGIILIFIFDGYMGVYDSLVMDSGPYSRATVNTDQWAEEFGFIGTGAERGSRVDFTYTVENHRFSRYSTTVEASAWYGAAKLKDLTNQALTVGPFGKGEVKWSLDTAELIPADYPAGQSYNLDVVIVNGDIERRVQVFINPSPAGIKVVPAPARQ